MPNIFKKLNGVINNVFSIGLKNNKTTLTSTASKLSIDKGIDVGANKIQSSATPSAQNDVVNVAYVSSQITANKVKLTYNATDKSLTIS